VGWRVSGDVQRRISEAEPLGSDRANEDTVLVVSEDFSTRQSLISVLASSNVEAFGATANEALANQVLYQPGVAVVEHTSTGVDGVALAGWLKERDPELQVLLLTDPASLDTAQPSSVIDGYLVKPLASAAFVPTVRGAFHHRALAIANKRLAAHEEPRVEVGPFEPQVEPETRSAAPQHPPGLPAFLAPTLSGELMNREPLNPLQPPVEPLNLQPLPAPGRQVPKRGLLRREPRNLEPLSLDAPSVGGRDARGKRAQPERAESTFVQPLVAEVPLTEPTFVQPPAAEALPTEVPVAEPTFVQPPAAEALPTEVPVAEPTFVQFAAAEAPAAEAPAAEAPVEQRPVAEAPAAEAPAAEAPVEQRPVAEPMTSTTAPETERTQSLDVSRFRDETGASEFDDRVRTALTMPSGVRAAGVFLVQLHLPTEYQADWNRHGAEVMAHVQDLLSSGRRRTDTVTPVGHGQFIVVCADVDSPATAELIASGMVRELSRPLSVEGVELPLIASLGIVLTQNDDEGARDPETLMEDASLALRLAWEEGQTWMVFDDAVGNGIRLREGLERAMDNGELGLDFQKVVDLQTSEVVGAEALLRWRRPGREVLSASEFVQNAYDTGLGVRLGRWVLDRALSELASWRDNRSLSEHFRLSVNVAAEEVLSPQFAEMVEKLLRDHGIPPSMLSLEMPERALGDAAGDVNAVESLNLLRELGVSCVVDDFGTGRSNLDWLQELPVTGLKIAPELVSALDRTDDRRGPALVRGVIALGHELQMMVVGEGVESVSQAVALRAMGCDLAQGYYMGRPEHSKELATALAS
jgi:EAL domain-containing protein (putative c-di-GMP-specific phosphodiesterase class I)/DNA-binding NarL/FixJ family response regulator